MPGQVGAELHVVSGQVEAEALHTDRFARRDTALQGEGHFGLAQAETAVGLSGRQAAQQQPGRARAVPGHGGDERVEFVERVHGDQGTVPDGQSQQCQVLGRTGDHEVLPAHTVPQGLAQFGGGSDVDSRPAGGGSFRPHGCLVGLLREVHETVDAGLVEDAVQGAQVGVEGVGQQEVERAAERVGEFLQQPAAQHGVGGRVGQGGKGGKGGGPGHRHSATSVPRPCSRASCAKRCPSAISVTTSPLL
ncbi:hypothetical protein SAVCW2_22600 [Streptomyces avermitilis]|nr:hypothetical protein SAVCW2_22600 [Streptomyces avermitilis]